MLHVIQVIIAAVLALEETGSCAWILLFATFLEVADLMLAAARGQASAMILDVMGAESSISDMFGGRFERGKEDG